MLIQKNGDGFLAIEKNIQGAFAEGDTKEEAEKELGYMIEMIKRYKVSKK